MSAQYTEYVCESKYLQNVCAWEKNDQANMKNVSGKMMSNNCAECVSIYTECVWENDLACYFKNLLMSCYVFITYITNIIMKTLNENKFTYLPLTTIGTCVSRWTW